MKEGALKVATFYIFLIVCLFAVTPVFPQSITNTGGVYGKVLDTEGNSLNGVRVRLDSDIAGPISAITSANGNFRFVNLYPGNYSLSFFLQGYLPVKRKDILVSTGKQVQVDVILEPTSNNTGVFYGSVTDKNGVVLQGVSVTLESDTVPQLQATTASDGFFRFEGLPTGKYLLVFKKKGFLDLKREQIELSSGANLQINVQLTPKSSLKEVPPQIERRSTGISWSYSREFLELLPNSQSIYALLDHTPAVDTDALSTIHSDVSNQNKPGQFVTAYARGSDNFSTVWNYDGLNLNVPDGWEPSGDWAGDFPSFFDLDSAQEVQIITAGNDISIPTGGLTVNVISRQGGKTWHGDASFFFSNDQLQSSNTPDEVKTDPRITTSVTNRLDQLKEYSFDLGGPVIPNKLFIWGAVHQGWVDRFNLGDELEKNRLTSYNIKANWNLSAAQQFQFGYLRTENIDTFPDGFEVVHDTENIFPGVLTAQYSWTVDPNTVLKGRYGYIGAGLRFEFLTQQTAHDFSFELNRFAEHLLGGNHELRFGLEHKTSRFRDGEFLDGSIEVADSQALPDDPLTEGSLIVGYPAVIGRSRVTRTSFYVADSYRNGRLTLNLGLRFDRQTGKNEPLIFPSPLQRVERPDFLGAGFEELIPDVVYPGIDPGLAADNLSPRIGATYDVTGTGRILVFGNVARYYQAYPRSLLDFSGVGNPFSEVVGPSFTAHYNDRNQDQVITPDEISDSNLTNYKFVLSQRIYDPRLTNRFVNEFVIGAQTELLHEFSVSAAFTHRSHHRNFIELPVGTIGDFPLVGTTRVHTSLGDFVIPLFTFPQITDRGTRILRNNNAYTQAYDGFDLMVQKRLRAFMLSGGLVLQRQHAHGYSKDFAPWFFFPLFFGATLTPTVNYAAIENQSYYPHSEWQLKVAGTYRFPRDVGLGLFMRYQQGFPFVLVGFYPPDSGNGFFFWPEPWSKRRLKNILTIDLRLDKGFRLRDYGRMDLILEILNLLNANTVLIRENNLGEIGNPNPDLNVIRQFLSPRVIRLGIRFGF